MGQDPVQPWSQEGARVSIRASNPGRFIDQHISPLFYHRTEVNPDARDCEKIIAAEQFWGSEGKLVFQAVRLTDFRITDWFPRVPGVFWSRNAQHVRQSVWDGPVQQNVVLGRYYSPESKQGLIEKGGIGTIRLRPRRIDGVDCWLATALDGVTCHSGIPLAIPVSLLRDSGIEWGEYVSLEGCVRFMQDTGLYDIAAGVHHVRPLIVFVNQLSGIKSKRSSNPIVITPVALIQLDGRERFQHRRAGYTFVHCNAGPDLELDEAAEWIEKYAEIHGARVITNFDEQRPVLADAPLSYQRLVKKNYERPLIEHFRGTISADRIDTIVLETGTKGGIQVGHKINVAGPAVINIDSVLENVTQTIGTAPGISQAKKTKLDDLVRSLKEELNQLKSSYADETAAIAKALENAISNVAKPPAERKKSLLQLSAKGLKDAAELVKDVAPGVLKTSTLVADFITRLGGT